MEAAKGNRERRRDGLRVPGLAALEKFGKPSIRPFIPSVDESDPAWTFPVTHPVAGGCDHRALTDQTNPKTLEWPASVLKLICEENKIEETVTNSKRLMYIKLHATQQLIFFVGMTDDVYRKI